MVDNLYTFDQIRSNLPDNSSNLISPENARSATLSAVPDVGEVGDDSVWTLVLAAGVPSNLNDLSPAAVGEVLRGWAIDANGALVPDWDGFTIATGLVRAVSISFVVVAQNPDAGDDTYLFELLRGAAVVATAVYVLEGGVSQSDALVGLLTIEPYEPGLDEPWSIQVTSTLGNDLDIEDWELTARGAAI